MEKSVMDLSTSPSHVFSCFIPLFLFEVAGGGVGGTVVEVAETIPLVLSGGLGRLGGSGVDATPGKGECVSLSTVHIVMFMCILLLM